MAVTVPAAQMIPGLFYLGHTDHAIPDSPCVWGLAGPVQPVYADGRWWVWYTCVEGLVIVREFASHNLPPVNPPMPIPQYDTTNPNWEGTGMTEAEWRRRYPVPR
jgi:hypothetical protein